MARLTRRNLAALLLAGAAMLAGAASASAQEAPTRIAVITHGQAADPYWSVVKNGVDAAAKTQGADVDYRSPDTFDMVQMAQLIDAAVASKPDGLVVSIPDADALGPSVQARHRGRHPGDRDRFRRGQAHPRAGRPALSRPVRVRGRRRRRRARGQARRQEGRLPQPGGRQHQPGRPLRRLRQGPGRRGAGGGRHHRPDRDEGPRRRPICAPIPTPTSCWAAASPRRSRRWPRSRSWISAARSRSAPSTSRPACCRRLSTARWSGASTPSST